MTKIGIFFLHKVKIKKTKIQDKYVKPLLNMFNNIVNCHETCIILFFYKKILIIND